MSEFRKIAVMDDVVQAQMMELLLKERNIPHAMHSYHDSAYDGLFQDQKGWGYIEASEENGPEILSLLAAVKEDGNG